MGRGNQRKWHPGQRLLGLSIFLLFLSLAISVAAREQGPAPTEDPQPRPTPKATGAPPRGPVVLKRSVLPNGAVNTIVALPAVADAYISSGRPDHNLSLGPLFLGYNLGGDNFDAERILLRFDVAGSIPAGVVINEAHLRLHSSLSVPQDDGPMGTVLRRLASTWGEDSVTWNREPVWGEIRASAQVSSTLDWYQWDVTSLVADWLDGVHPNDGMEIIGDERIQERERAFYSRETGTDLFPLIVVDYTNVSDHQPPIVTVDPLPEFEPRTFTVSWSGTDQGSAGIDHYDVQYRVDGGDWINWRFGVTTTSDEFTAGQNGRLYEFRARGTDRAGNVEPFGDVQAWTTVDTQPPTSEVDPLPRLIKVNSITASWRGNDDDGSGIRYFDVRYRVDGGAWLLWLPETLATSATLANAEDGVYDFEVRAVDNVGNVEPFTGQAEASTIVDVVPPFVVPRLWMPLIFNES